MEKLGIVETENGLEYHPHVLSEPQKNKKESQGKRKADKISPSSKRQKESVGVGANELI